MSRTVYQAFRRTQPAGFWRGLFADLVRLRLVSRYCHGGIVIGGTLYHATFSGGLHSEPFVPDGWELFPTTADEADVLARFRDRQGARYDAISLLAFLLPWRVRDRFRLYCFEWQWLGETGVSPVDRVTPEDLLALIATQNKKEPWP